MILYFSATGNNKYIAQKIAGLTADAAVSIEEYKENQICLKEGENLGIIVPTYFLELPPNMVSFLNDVTFVLPNNTYVFGVVTYGSTSGACGAHLKSVLNNKGINTDALFSIITPDTWTIAYDLSDPKQVNKILMRTEAQLAQTIEKIKKRKKGDFRTRQLPFFVKWIWDVAYQKARQTSHFHVEDSCIGCGLCKKNCPEKAIEIQNGRPVWRKDKCLVCLRCLHSCPEFSIQYGDKTAAHGQYRHEMYREVRK
ncbi:MAG: EFR1 family ferrodoxin [Lachnospiraceae bacterium]|nr:EFR1 family ferrodoxin [Lachnospiraceae bacterium]